MICDSLQNASRYAGLHPGFGEALSFFASLTAFPARRVDLDGDKLFILFSDLQGKERSEALLEAHKKYIDIHCCFEGRESIGWRALRNCAGIRTPYDDEKDLITFIDSPAFWSLLTPGTFAIYFPEDAHAPMVSDGVVRKAVAKVACR